VTIQEGNGGPPLIVAPDIYGDTLMGYRELARRLGPEQRVLALRARGLDRINKPHTRIEDMAAAYVEDIRRVQHEGPYLLVGHCFGGNVALDVAGRLRADGQEVGLLALIDAAPYGHRASKRPMVNVGLHLTALRRRAITREYVRARLKAARVRFLRQVWWHGGHWLYRRTGILIPFLRADVAEANLRAAGEYVAPSYAGEVMLFLVGALDDVRNNQRATAWRSVASGGVDIHEIVGDEVNHLSILHEPHVRVIAAPLRERIAALAGPPPAS
jgi:thioesterase domain-containing protein